jgi:D-alanine-D-alanine ligase-like ATP-grasp enzyme
MQHPSVASLIVEVARPLGITVEFEPEFHHAGELVFPDGRRHVFRGPGLNINPSGASQIASDKSYTRYFLRKYGFRTPNGRNFFSDRRLADLAPDKRRGLTEAIAFAQQIGYPLFVKPNNGTCGEYVTKAYETADVMRAAQAIFKHGDVLLVEETCTGHDYRLLVLDNRIIAAYQRIPLTVVGDGVHTIGELLHIYCDRWAASGWPLLHITPEDFRIDIRLTAIGKSRNSVPGKGEQVRLLDSANLSTGGTCICMTKHVHPSFAHIAVDATKALQLQFCGVDILAADITQEASLQDWHIIELNAAAKFDHYACQSVQPAECLRTIYRQILQHLARSVPSPSARVSNPGKYTNPNRSLLFPRERTKPII